MLVVNDLYLPVEVDTMTIIRDSIQHYREEGYVIKPYDVISIEASQEDDYEASTNGPVDDEAACDCNGDCDCDCDGTCACRTVA